MIGLAAAALTALAVHPKIPESAYPSRRAAVVARLGSDVLIVPGRSSFQEDDQLGFRQAPSFQYLTGLDSLVGAVLVIDGSSSTSTLYVAPKNPLLTKGVVIPGGESARALQVSDVRPVADLEPWLRARFVRAPTTVLVAPTDARASVAAPVPMAASVARWEAWLATLGAAKVASGLPLLRSMRDIKDSDEMAILRRVGNTSGAAMLAGMRALGPSKWQHDTELAVVNACHAAGARGISFWPWTM